MDQRYGKGGASFLKNYDRRSGTDNQGIVFETNITALVALRCIALEDTEDMWMGSNVAQFGDFDDIVLYRRTSEGRRLIYMLQLKHQETPTNITKSEFENIKGHFSISKYSKTFNSLKEHFVCKENDEHEVFQYLRDVDDRFFVLYTNKGVDQCNFLEKYYDSTIDFLDTSSSNENRLKFSLNQSGVPENFILFSNQITANNATNLIEREINLLLGPSFRLSPIESNRVVNEFVDFIRTWAKGANVNNTKKYFTLTKYDVISKLTGILLGPYQYKLSDETFGNCPENPIWNKITQDKIITIVDSDEAVGAFLNQYIASEVRKYLRGFEESWTEKLYKKTMKLISKIDEDLEMNLLKMIADCSKITILDLYVSLWNTNKIPLLLEINAIEDYENILKILNISNYSLRVIIIKNKTVKLETKTVADTKYFITLEDLNNEDRDTILNRPIKLQNRNNHELQSLIDESMYKLVTCKDVIQILQGSFNVGNEYEALTEALHIARTLSRVLLKPPVLKEIKDEIFILKDKRGLEQKPIGDKNSFPKNVIVVEEPKTLEDESWRGKVIHEVFLYGDDYLEWKRSFGTTRNIMKYVREQEEDSIGFAPGIGWSSFVDGQNYFLKDTHIISAASGMGKSTFADFMAVHVPTNIWVIKIILNKYQEYYKNIQNKSVLDQLKFFTDCLLQESKNLELSKAIFKKCLIAKHVLVILDGFDEIVIRNEKEVITIAKCLHKEGIPLWLTTRPNKKHELEEIFCSIALTLNPLTVYDQRKLFKKHFHRMCTSDNLHHETFQSVIETFVDTLMEVVRHNFNDSRGKFMGIPLHVELLAQEFSADCQKSLQTGSIILKETFHLVDLYEKVITRKIDILCDKFGNDVKTTRVMIEKYQKLFALTYLYHRDLLKNLKINEQLDEFYTGEEYKRHFLQREGIVLVEQKHNGEYNINFTHRTFAEYLAAGWFSENVPNADYKIKRSVSNLINYSTDFDLVGGMLNLMLSKDNPLHAAVLTENVEEAKRILEAHPSSVSELDKGGRTILHIVAIKRNVNPQITNKLRTIFNDNIKDTKDLICGFTALDYANFYGHYELANQMCESYKNLAITSASFNLDDNTQQFLEECIRRNYKSLFEAVLRFHVSRMLLERSCRIECRLPFVFESHDSSSLLANYMNKYYTITISDFLQFKFKNVYSPVGHYYYDFAIACAFGTVNNIKYLLSEGAEINSSNFDVTPLHYAAHNKRFDIVKLLLDEGAKTNKPDEDELLHIAAQMNWPDVIRRILALGACINKQNQNGNTPLSIALHNSNWLVGGLLLLNGANCNLKDTSGSSSLHYAARGNCSDIITELLKRGALVNQQNKNGDTPLNISLEKGNFDVSRLLLMNGANCNLENTYGYSSVHYAARRNCPDIITELLKLGALVDKQNKNGDTPLNISLQNSNWVVGKLLLLNGANCNLEDTFGSSSLHYAARYNCPDIITELLKQGALVDNQNKHGDTPLKISLEKGNFDISRLLLLNGANCNLEDTLGSSPLHYAARYNCPDILTELLKQDALVDKQNKNGDTPLNISLEKGNFDISKLLLLNGANCNLENASGSSSLHYAAQRNCPDIITELLKQGALVDKQNKNGDTPLHIAVKYSTTGTAEVLVNKGADINLQNSTGQTALHTAVIFGTFKPFKGISLFRFLLDKGPDINIQDKNGNTPLHLTYNEKFGIKFVHEARNLLIERGVDTNLKNKFGETASMTKF